jgi:thymidine phosphorylase
VCDAPDEVLPRARVTEVIAAERDGVVARLDAEAIGIAGVWLGAGRRTKEDAIDPAAGVVLAAREGGLVRRGQPLATLHHDEPGADRVAQARALVAGAISVDERITAWPRRSRVIEVLRGTLAP